MSLASLLKPGRCACGSGATRRTVRGSALKLPVLLCPCNISRRNMAAEKTNTSTRPSKSEFIREQPSTMSAADVIAKGEAEGIPLSTDLVYGVRSRARLKKATKVAAKNTGGEKRRRDEAAQTSKADFVQKRPAASPKVRSAAKTGKAKTKGETRTATPYAEEDHAQRCACESRSWDRERQAPRRNRRDHPSGSPCGRHEAAPGRANEYHRVFRSGRQTVGPAHSGEASRPDRAGPVSRALNDLFSKYNVPQTADLQKQTGS